MKIIKMFLKLCIFICFVGFVTVTGYPYNYRTENFRVGIEYHKSLPMSGGSDRFRHRNNYDPFFVTITATARKGFVLSYLDVKATVALGGEVDFQLIRGSTGSTTMVFQLVSNHSDFLTFQYLAYGIREEEYKKITNIITLPIGNTGWKMHLHLYTVVFILLHLSLNTLQLF